MGIIDANLVLLKWYARCIIANKIDGKLKHSASFQVALRSLNLGICPKLKILSIEAPCMVSLELKGCGVLSEASINCPLLTSLDASFCRSCYFLVVFLAVPAHVPWLICVIYMQPTQGWLLVCNHCILPTDWVIDFNVLPFCWFWRTTFFAAASTFVCSWFVIHFFDESAASVRLLFATEGTS